MTLTIDLALQTEAWISAEARYLGVPPSDIIRRILDERATTTGHLAPLATADPDNDPLRARLEARIAAAPIDPDAIREVEEYLNELMRNMNANRAATGERLPFPEVNGISSFRLYRRHH